MQIFVPEMTIIFMMPEKSMSSCKGNRVMPPCGGCMQKAIGGVEQQFCEQENFPRATGHSSLLNRAILKFFCRKFNCLREGCVFFLPLEKKYNFSRVF